MMVPEGLLDTSIFGDGLLRRIVVESWECLVARVAT
jgi:hypothetical protein